MMEKRRNQIGKTLIGVTLVIMLFILFFVFLLPILKDSQFEFIYDSIGILFSFLSLVILPILLYIIFIKLLISFKDKFILIGGFFSSVIILISTPFLMEFLFNIEFFRKYFFGLINYLDNLITGCETECMYRMIIQAIVMHIVIISTTLIILFIILRIKKKD